MVINSPASASAAFRKNGHVFRFKNIIDLRYLGRIFVLLGLALLLTDFFFKGRVIRSTFLDALDLHMGL